MIPKIIHYCWLSGDEFPLLIKKCIKTWKRVLPDYDIVCWDKTRFDINAVPWVKDAYDAKKYAFAADYIRFYALYHHGGIYLDSDVEVLKKFDDLLSNSSFIGYENASKLLEPAVIGAEKGHLWCKKMMEHYESKSFGPNTMQVAPMVIHQLFSAMFSDFPSKYVTKTTLIDEGRILLCPPVFFSPIQSEEDKNFNKNKEDNIQDLRDNPMTYCIHRFNGSWVSSSRRFWIKIVEKTVGIQFVKNIMILFGLR